MIRLCQCGGRVIARRYIVNENGKTYIFKCDKCGKEYRQRPRKAKTDNTIKIPYAEKCRLRTQQEIKEYFMNRTCNQCGGLRIRTQDNGNNVYKCEKCGHTLITPIKRRKPRKKAIISE